MGNTASAPDQATGRRRGRPWFLLGALAVLLVLFGGYYLRGTWAAATPTDPATPGDGVRSQLVLGEDGGKDVRTAVVVPVPLEMAWELLSNYEEWERLFDNRVRRKEPSDQQGKDQHHVESDVRTPLGTITLDFVVTHERLAGGGYLARWDAPTEELPVNKGTIRITPLDEGLTLLVYTVRKQYRKYPQFLVNNMLLRDQRALVRTLAKRMVEIAQGT